MHKIIVNFATKDKPFNRKEINIKTTDRKCVYEKISENKIKKQDINHLIILQDNDNIR